MSDNSAQAAYWDRQPCNVRHPEWKYMVEPHIPAFAQFERWNGKRVLEVGCGVGVMTLRFAQAGAKVEAVDLSRQSLELARDRLNSAHAYAILHHMDFEYGLPTDTRLFHLIYSFGVLHHTADPEAMLFQMRRYCYDEGRLKLMVYNKWSYKHLRILLLGERTEAQAGCPIARMYSRGEIRQLVERHGFKVIRIQTHHLFPYRISDYKEGRLVKTLGFRYMPNWLYHILERLVGWHLLVDAVAV